MNLLTIVFVVAFSFVVSRLWRGILETRGELLQQRKDLEQAKRLAGGVSFVRSPKLELTESVEGRGYGEVGVEVAFEAPDDGTAAAVLLALAAAGTPPSLYYRYPIHWHGTRTRVIDF